ncbi:MAG: NADH:ubiquinone reductase (Na(+)-transporting) subunit C [Bacteroidales bacterium]|nr:NADH:ubiquinone reductase (Na(+)-transporting) subunit C [Bacteroidales bacterium]
MKSFSNTYIFIFSAVMVILVATLLSFVAMKLKPIQDNNIKIEKMQNILNSVHINSTKKDAEDLFKKYVKDSYVINIYGQKLSDEKALEIDLKKEVAKIEEVKLLRKQLTDTTTSPFRDFMSKMVRFEETNKGQVDHDINDISQTRHLPVYIVEKEGKTYYVFPMQGKGLWGPIWGFISVEDDLNTVYGAVFDHKSETPGLGAEISQDFFEQMFRGKLLFQDKLFKSISVVKGGAAPDDVYGVDAISGGTITSKGVEAMIYDCLVDYTNFFENQRN